MLFQTQDLSMRGVSTRDLHTPGIYRGPFAEVGPVSWGGRKGCQTLPHAECGLRTSSTHYPWDPVRNAGP